MSQVISIGGMIDISVELAAPEILKLQNVSALGKDLRMVTMLGSVKGVPAILMVAQNHWKLCQNSFSALKMNV